MKLKFSTDYSDFPSGVFFLTLILVFGDEDLAARSLEMSVTNFSIWNVRLYLQCNYSSYLICCVWCQNINHDLQYYTATKPSQ